jgi:acetyltransferase
MDISIETCLEYPQRMKPHYLSPFFSPQSVAIVGASERKNSISGMTLSNMLASGYRGKLYAVNPKYEMVHGVRCYPSLEAIGQAIDLVMLATPAQTAPALMEEAGRMGNRSVVVLSGGFSEVGAEGLALEQAMMEAAHRYGIRVLGPNCIGVIRPSIGLCPPFIQSGTVAMVSQSTALASGVLDWASGNDIGFSAMVSVSNSSDIDFAEVVDYLVSDAQTQSILLFVERIYQPRIFMSALREAARVKPVIILKADRWGGLQSGLAELDPQVVAQHDAIFDAALKRAGVVRVRTLTDLFAAARSCSVRYRKSGPRLAIISNGEGPGALAMDQARDVEIPLATLSQETIGRLNKIMPRHWNGINPLDLGNIGNAETYREVSQTVLADPQVDSLLVMLSPQVRSEADKTAKVLAELAPTTTKPLMACFMGERQIGRARTFLARAGVPHFRTPESAVKAFEFTNIYHHNQKMLFQTPAPAAPEKAPDVELARALVSHALADGHTATLSEREVERLLKAFHLTYRSGIPLPPLLDGAGGRRGMTLGIVRDFSLGPALFLGPQGMAAELSGTFSYGLPPMNHFLASEFIRGSSMASLFNDESFAVNQEELVELFMRLSSLACEVPQIQKLTLELWLYPQAPAEIAHARVELRRFGEQKSAYAHMAIHPYPADLVRAVTLPKGHQVTFRPIRPEDAEMEQDFVRSLSDDSRYYRFMDALRELPRSLLVRFTQLDYQREMAIVAVEKTADGTEKQVGVARYITNPDGESCEFALVIADDWQGRGLGRTLMRYLMDIAAARGYKTMDGEVLSVNGNMLKLMTTLGFEVHTAPDDPAVKNVSAILIPD